MDTNKEWTMAKVLEELFSDNLRNVKQAIKAGFDINTSYNKNSWNPFMWIVKEYQDPEIIREFIDLGGKVNGETSSGETPLMIAARKRGSPEIIQLLIDNGADVNHQDIYGYTALMRLLEHPQVQMRKSVVQCLLDNGADLQNLRNNSGNSAADLMLKLI